ncbi:hypothetical protein DC20_03820 [Rufibacter tibetensis]|uniref:Uncharacterized protein n=1 Tax=Rufibacter tibetensis TaxID=512763 RepID=A0A0P0CMP6_9BACT|nr:hypothetical protein DC20_03820 [Rufibacter tibetensis]
MNFRSKGKATKDRRGISSLFKEKSLKTSHVQVAREYLLKYVVLSTTMARKLLARLSLPNHGSNLRAIVDLDNC